MDMIMQPDGTMKLEPRRGDKDYIVARAGYGQKKGAAGKPKQSDLIYAAEETKGSCKEVRSRIFAYHRTRDR